MSLNKIQLITNILLLIMVSICFILYAVMAPQHLFINTTELPQLTLFLLNIGWFSLILPSTIFIIGIFLIDKPPIYSWYLNQCTWLLVVSSILLIFIGSVLPYTPMCETI